MTMHLDLIIEILIFVTIVAATWFFGREIERVIAQRRRLGGQGTTAAGSAAPLLQGRGVENRFFQWVQASTSISEPGPGRSCAPNWHWPASKARRRRSGS